MLLRYLKDLKGAARDRTKAEAEEVSLYSRFQRMAVFSAVLPVCNKSTLVQNLSNFLSSKCYTQLTLLSSKRVRK